MSLNALRSLFAYLVQRGALNENSALEVRLPARNASMRLLVTDEDLIKLLATAEQQRTTFRSVRVRAILSVFIRIGLRRQERLERFTRESAA